jgi:hypothetical protein
MLYAAIDIHKHVFQAATLDPESGELVEARLPATREALSGWLAEWDGRLVAVAIEATCGWRWVARELQRAGVEVRLAEPVQARALKGRRRQAKTDKLDARWLATLLAKEMLPTSWLPPEDIQRLRDLTRLRQALRHDRTRWAQRLHAILLHEGWPCSRSQLLTANGRRWLEALTLDRHVRRLVDAHLAMIDASWGADRRDRPRNCVSSRATTRDCSHCRRSTASDRCSPRTCSPRSATPAASAAPARSSASPASTRSCSSQAKAAAAASSPSKAHRTCAGRSSRPPNKPRAEPPALTATSTCRSSNAPAANAPPSPPPASSPAVRTTCS